VNRVHDGRLRRDSDRFFNGADLQLSIELDGPADLDPYVLLVHRLEPLERERDAVHSNREAIQPVETLCVCHFDNRTAKTGRTRGLDRHTDQNPPLRVADDTANAARRFLRGRERRRHQDDDGPQEKRRHFHRERDGAM
jgi:hypothetical protein